MANINITATNNDTQDDIHKDLHEECCGGEMDWELDKDDESYDEDELIQLIRGIGIGISDDDEDEDDPGMNIDDDEPEPGPGPGYIGTEGSVGTALGTGTIPQPSNRVRDTEQESLELLLDKLSGLKLS